MLELCLNGALQPVLTPAIDAENRHILRKVRPPDGFMDKIDALGRCAEWVEPREGIAICEAPDDDKFIAGALGAFGVVLAFAANGTPSVVMSIVFAGAPIVNACVALAMHPPPGGLAALNWPFLLGILLAAAGGFLVSLYKPG